MNQIKISFIFSLIATGLCSPAFAENADLCRETATQAVETKFPHYFFQMDRRIRDVKSVNCEKTISRSDYVYQTCQIVAGDGSAPDEVHFTVLQNEACTHAFAVFLSHQE